MKGGTDPAPIPVDPKQWRAGGRGTGEFSVEEEIPTLVSENVRGGRSEVAALELGS